MKNALCAARSYLYFTYARYTWGRSFVARMGLTV